MEEILIPVMIVGMLFIGLPWLILHYVTRWKSAATLPAEDERLLEDMYDTARRLEDRLHTVERIIAADNPDWRPSLRSETETIDDPRIGYRRERSQ